METRSAARIAMNGRAKDGEMPALPASRSPFLPLSVLAAAFVYALVRYVVLGDTSVAQIPLYVSNKALAAGAVAFLMAAAAKCVRGDKPGSIYWGRWALHTAGLHALASIVLLPHGYYPKFFVVDTLSGSGQWSLLAAVGALYGFLTIGSRNAGRRRVWALASSILAAAHVALYGMWGWLDVGAWPGGLPPISMLTFLMACGAVAAYAAAVRARGRGRTTDPEAFAARLHSRE